MSAPVATASSVIDFQGLAKLRAQSQEGGGDNLKEVAAQFESLFIQMMLKSMREASPAEDEIFNSDAMKQYRDMMDQQLALDMARKGGVGLADHIVSQLGGGEAPIPTSPSGQSYVAVAQQISSAATQSPVVSKGEDWRPDSPEAFIRDLLPKANKASEELGVPAEAIVAQAALETGWGKHQMQLPEGRSSFNLFGIKAGPDWDGRTVRVQTLEYRDGIAQKETALFRAYDSLEEGLQDYVSFLKGNNRYATALSQQDADGFAKALQEAGYATDPQYADKIQSIAQRPEFKNLAAELKLSDKLPIS
jgi:peptidoglycan hydrolase FlgJ